MTEHIVHPLTTAILEAFSKKGYSLYERTLANSADPTEYLSVGPTTILKLFPDTHIFYSILPTISDSSNPFQVALQTVRHPAPSLQSGQASEIAFYYDSAVFFYSIENQASPANPRNIINSDLIALIKRELQPDLST